MIFITIMMHYCGGHIWEITTAWCMQDAWLVGTITFKWIDFSPWELHVSLKSLGISAQRRADTSIKANRETKTTTTTTASITLHQHWMVEKSHSSHSGNSISVFITVSNQKDASSKSHQAGKKMDWMQINDDGEGGKQAWKMRVKG